MFIGSVKFECLRSFFYFSIIYKPRTMSLEKENFLRNKFIGCLQRLDATTKPLWGKMNVQQMIEHFIEVVMVANGKIKMNIVTPADKLPRYREFMMSETPFKENTKSPVLPEEPSPLKYATKQAAIGVLHEELIDFFEVFDKNPSMRTTHPAFGALDLAENVQIMHKHAVHHLKQFGVELYSLD